jgi:hypothetical protein
MKMMNLQILQAGKFLWVVLIAVTSFQALAQDVRSKSIEFSHGTINIILANKNGLVAVTDSMISRGTDHTPNGVKLFKLDDRTICTMAGLYDAPGPRRLKSLEMSVPQIMKDLADRMNTSPEVQSLFEKKAVLLAGIFEHRLTSNLQALVAAGEDVSDIQPLYLTLAGYDTDGSLKIAEIAFDATSSDSGAAFKPAIRPLGPFLVPCEVSVGVEPLSHFAEERQSLLYIRKIGDPLFCEIAGIPNVAENMLKNSEKFRDVPSIASYTDAKNEGRSLSIDEMRRLAIELARQTTLNETATRKNRVGGQPQVAILGGGKIIDVVGNSSAEPIPSDTGGALTGNHFFSTDTTCGSPSQKGFVVNNVGTQMQVKMTDCSQELDGIVFHDSVFTNSRLYYLGRYPDRGDLIFSKTNVVKGSTLELGPDVDTNHADVRQLVCGFPWKAVFQRGSEIKLSCPATQAK